MTGTAPEGQNDLCAIGWVGLNPQTRLPQAHLLLFPADDAWAPMMAQVGELLGLAPPGTEPPRVPVERTRVAVDEIGCQVLTDDGQVMAELSNPTVASVVGEHGTVLLWVASHAVGGGVGIEDHLTDAIRLGAVYWGLVETALDATRTPTSAESAAAPRRYGTPLFDMGLGVPPSEEDMIAKAACTQPVMRFFAATPPERVYTMAEIGEGTGIGPRSAIALGLCLDGLVDLGVLIPGQSAGGAGPTWRRAPSTGPSPS